MFEQLMIAVTGVIAIFLTQSNQRNTQRYACLFGLAGQPFWLFATWQSQQWGMFVLSLFYTVAWGKGLHMYWLNKTKEIKL